MYRGRDDEADSAGPTTAWRGSAFGLRLRSELPLVGLEPEPERDAGATADTLVARATARAIAAEWPAGEAERLAEHRYGDGSKVVSVDLHPSAGYLVDAPFHGRYRIALDGAVVECAPAPGPSWRWHRPLLAQALPLAAALRGIEVLHASAVVLDGAAVAFVGHSGAGKTSLAVNLVDRGAALLTDDVLALSAVDGAVLAHPGARFANVAPEQLEGLASGPERLGPVLGRTGKLHLFVEPMAPAAVPLRALCFLERGERVPELELERIERPGPAPLLAATFLAHVSTPVRLVAQLEVCSLIDREVASYRLRIPAGVSAAELAGILPERLAAAGAARA